MPESCIGTIRAADILRPYLTNANSRGIPIAGTVELTNKCNLRCLHCYIRPWGDQVSSNEPNLSTNQWINILAEAIDCGCLFLTLTGGEILVRPDFWKIYKYIKMKGTIVNLFTNGTRITERLAAELAEWPPNMIEISLYGITRNTYESITQIPGSYKDCMNGIDLLAKHELPFRLKSVITTLNHHELPIMRDFADKMGVHFRYDPEINKRLDNKGGPELLRLTPEQIVRLDLVDSKRAAEFMQIFRRRTVPTDQVAEPLFFCRAGMTTFHIDYQGYMNPCIMARLQLCSLVEVPFAKAWYQFLPTIHEMKRTRRTVCDRCDVAHACNQCPGWAKFESGDPEEPVPFLCRITRLRQEVFQTTLNSNSGIQQYFGSEEIP